MNKITVVTATRAEYGILVPLIKALDKEKEIDLQLVVTGTHLSDKYGRTENEIIKDGFSIFKRIPILEEGNSAYDISVTVANAIKGFAEYFRDEEPRMVFILGDRTEMLGVAIAAMNEGVPIAHIHGGEITEGAVDDCVRHALTKMSYLHFTSTEEYRKRVIQMGEAPERVFNVGALSTENILNVPRIPENELREDIGIPLDMDYCVVTFHPVTLEPDAAREQTEALCEAMEKNNDLFYLITMANADNGGELVNEILNEFATSHSNAKMVSSLGMKRYLSAVKYARFVLGNSSSGIIEAPVLGTPTVNIGDRQKGRIMAGSIVNCEPEIKDISAAIDRAKSVGHKTSYIYGDGTTSKKILKISKQFLCGSKGDVKKNFFDLNVIYY